jgi:hypothetical protein
MRRTSLTLAAAVLAVSTAAIAQVAAEPPYSQPTPKRRTKAEKKAAKRDRRNAGVDPVDGGQKNG